MKPPETTHDPTTPNEPRFFSAPVSYANPFRNDYAEMGLDPGVFLAECERLRAIARGETEPLDLREDCAFVHPRDFAAMVAAGFLTPEGRWTPKGLSVPCPPTPPKAWDE